MTRRILATFLMGWALCIGFLSAAGGGATAEERTMTPLSGGGSTNEGVKTLPVGAEAPDFAVPDLNGTLFHYGEEKGKAPFLFVFWSMFCEPCRIEMPILQNLYRKYGENGLEVVAIALDGVPLRNSIAGFVRQEGYTFRVLVDEVDPSGAYKIADPYGVAWTPTIYILDRGGKVVFARAGRVKEEELAKALQSVLRK